MADHQDDRYQEDGYQDQRRPLIPRKRSVAARAAVVLALVIVLGFAVASWYALDNVRGDDGGTVATAEPPLIKAEPAPYKRKPEDPGGMLIPNQDKHVYERILPGQPETTETEKLLPKPEEPMSRPQPEEKPVPPAPTEQQTTMQEKQPAAAGGTENMQKPATDTEAAKPAMADKPAMAEKNVAERPDAKPPAPAPSEPAKSEPQVATTEPQAAAGGVPPAPAEKPEQEKAAPVPAPVAPTITDLSKSYRVQLAAFRDGAEAEKAWETFAKRFPDELGSLRLHVQQVEIRGKGTYHRLQAGPFASADAAAATCQALKARKQDCLVVRP